MRVPSPRRVLAVALGLAVLGAALLAVGYVRYAAQPLVEVVHLPDRYPHRSGDLSANVSLRLHPDTREIRYRVNHGSWRDVDRWSVRTPVPMATLELLPEDLRPGVNDFEVQVKARLLPPATLVRTVLYDPAPLQLPLEVRWGERDLEVQDGAWEAVERDGTRWVRPRPGFEGYDRILLATGAFPVDRRIETEVVFRRHVFDPERPATAEFGFGVLSLWGGHPDREAHFPRRGWSFAMAWWWSKPAGVGNEISYKEGAGEPTWVNGYRDAPLVADTPYRVVIEVRDVRDADGRHRAYRQRMKWWLAGASPPSRWLEIEDVEGAPLPEGEYAIGLMAFNCQAEFGPVRVSALP